MIYVWNVIGLKLPQTWEAIIQVKRVNVLFAIILILQIQNSLRAKHRKAITTDKQSLDFPVDDLGIWPEGFSLSRENMYGDDGR